MATDYLLTGYRAIKTLLTADASLSAVVRRWVWFDGNDSHPEPETKGLAKQPADVAELKLDWDTMTDSQRTQTRTLGNVQTDSSCPFIGTETHEFLVIVTVDDVRLTTMSAILGHVRRVLREGATVDVGADAKARIGRISARNVKTVQSEAAKRLRRIATLRVPLTVSYHGLTQV